MHIGDILTLKRSVSSVPEDSKKRVLELASELMADDLAQGPSAKKIFASLVERERLGSTAIGHGVAIPHARIEGLGQPTGALLQLDKGINFSALDEQPVDLIFALAVPASANEEHLTLLAALAQMFNETTLRERLRNAKDSQALHQVIVDYDG